jgi:Phage integrase family
VLGKGRRPRAVPFGVKTTQAPTRYLRPAPAAAERRAAPMARRPEQAGDDAERRSPSRRRAEQAGIDDLHPHMLRHTSAHTWLNEGDMRRITGWKSSAMVNPYGASAADQRRPRVPPPHGPRRPSVGADEPITVVQARSVPTIIVGLGRGRSRRLRDELSSCLRRFLGSQPRNERSASVPPRMGAWTIRPIH